MARADEGGSPAPLPTDEVFRVLGNETRLRILRTLGEADGALSFTELRDRVGIHQGGEFNYHLDKVVGHFVKKTDDGYRLRGAGRQVVQAVLAGAITDDPDAGPTRTEAACPYCDSELLLDVNQEHLGLYCMGCDGARPTESPWESIDSSELGFLGILWFPPAGVSERSPEEMFEAAALWSNLEVMAVVNGLCPRCAAPIEPSIHLCDDHDAGDGLCEQCGLRPEMRVHNHCTNCIFGVSFGPARYLLRDSDARAFMLARGIDPIADKLDWGWDVEVIDVRSTDPYEVTFAVPIKDETLIVTVDDDLTVVEVYEQRVTEAV